MEAEEESLAQIGIEILIRFPELINAASQSRDESILRCQAQFRDELERFQLFAANLSLVQNGHSSLDYRLRESDLLQSSVRRLLQDLIDSLEEASQLCAEKLIYESSSGSPDQLPESSGSAAENDQDEDELLEAGYGAGTDGDVPAIELILESISDAIDRLFWLATKIRNSGAHQIAERVYTYKDVDEATGVNVIDEYAKFDRQHVLQLFDYQREASPNEPHHCLVERLSQANTFRRQQFGYWRRRRRKLQPVPAPAVGKPSLPDELPRLNLRPGAGETTKPVQALSRVATSGPYTASMFDPSKIKVDDNKSTVSISEYAPTARGLNNETIDWPSPPSKLKGTKHFECPYCFTLCSSRYLERKAWRAHLLRDLRPYICTYEHCAEAKKLYDTRKEWAAHENSIHRRIWRCLEHPEITFQNRAAYEDHLTLQHPQETHLQSFQLMRAGESTTSLPDRPCPFCQAEFPSSSTLQDHLAFHLEQIARFALPRSTSVDDQSTSSEYGSADAVGHNDESQGDSLKVESLVSFSADSDTSKSRVKHKTDSDSVQKGDGGTTAAKTGQRLDQSALKVLEANTSGSGGVNVSGFLQHLEGRRSETLQAMEQVVQLRKIQLGEYHPDTLGSMHNLAVRYSEAGRRSEALQLMEQVVQLRKTQLGEDHPDTLASMQNLAIRYSEVRRRSEALQLMRQVVQLCKTQLGEYHPDTLGSMQNLAIHYSEAGRRSEASQLTEQVVQLRKTQLGEDYPNTLANNLLRPDHFYVGWICAVQTEYLAACELLDEEYPELLVSSAHDKHTYTFGRMSQHNIVIACPRSGKLSLASVASVAKDMLYSFPSIRFGLMVGIAGGAPSKKHDIRLGDVVVSWPTGGTGGVIYYGWGDMMFQNTELERTGALEAPPGILLAALGMIRARREQTGHQITETVRGIVDKNPRLRRKYGRPEAGMDRLYESTFAHPYYEQSCTEMCEKETARIVQRHERAIDEDDPAIHYGLIASTDQLIKDARIRDNMAREEGVLCFETDMAGLMDHFPCVVVRGICDYSDTHITDIWQGYAAATAAAYAKELLEVIEPREVYHLPASINRSRQTEWTFESVGRSDIQQLSQGA